jgi:hypothetical protein
MGRTGKSRRASNRPRREISNKPTTKGCIASRSAPHASIAVLPCYGGESMLRRLFEPLGFGGQVEVIAPAALRDLREGFRAIAVAMAAEVG